MKFIIALLCLTFTSFANATSGPKLLKYTIIAERPHNINLFTQGLLLSDGHFYESSGGYGESLIVRYPVATEKNLLTKPIAGEYFAEGLTTFNNQFYLLTWREGKLLVFDGKLKTLLDTLDYSGEGWGLTNNGEQLIRSDGSNTLSFHDPENFALVKALAVTIDKMPVINLNELEYSEGFIWANIWQDNRILQIDPITGTVVGVVDLTRLVQSLKLRDPEAVLNGIAYDGQQKAFWITGKRWPKLFLIKFF